DIGTAIIALRSALLDLAEPHAATIMPGFTHLQVAQPVTFGHHLLAYEAMLARDSERLIDCRRRVNRLPLGSAALAGTSFPIDRDQMARELGFEGLCTNSLDAVSDRDFAIEFAAAGALLMMHLSRFAEELVLWSSPRFGFVRLADRFCTGSSIMPQKKNPDVPELVRGKTGRVYGDLVALLTLMKAQPLAYNKDNQEDKAPVFDVVDTLLPTLGVLTALVSDGIEVDAERMRAAASEGYATATDLADYLAKKGLPFRDAHEAVAQAVRHAESEQCDLATLSLASLQRYSPLIEDDVYAVLTLCLCASAWSTGSMRSSPSRFGPRAAIIRVARRRHRCARRYAPRGPRSRRAHRADVKRGAPVSFQLARSNGWTAANWRFSAWA